MEGVGKVIYSPFAVLAVVASLVSVVLILAVSLLWKVSGRSFTLGLLFLLSWLRYSPAGADSCTM